MKMCRELTLHFFGIFLLGIITGCSTVKTETVDPKSTNQESQIKSSRNNASHPSFVGTWLNEGEQCRLRIKNDGTCSLWYLDIHKPEGEDEITVEGTWKQKGRILTVNFDKEWWGSRGKEQTYYFERSKSSKGNVRDALKVKYDGREQTAFGRVEP